MTLDRPGRLLMLYIKHRIVECGTQFTFGPNFKMLGCILNFDSTSKKKQGKVGVRFCIIIIASET